MRPYPLRVLLMLSLLAGGGACATDDLVSEEAQGVSGPAPDYVVTSMTDPPAAAVNGATFAVTATVANAGTAGATLSSKTKYFLSADLVVGADKVFAQATIVPPLAVGATDTQTATVKVPSVASGTYYLLACADKATSVPELDNHNNCRFSTTVVAVTGPDLRVTAISDPPAALDAGDTFAITDTVANAGTANAGASTVGYYLSPFPGRGPGSFKLPVKRKIGPLAAGASTTGTVTATVPAVPSGSYYAVACADLTRAVIESDEKNNCTASAGTTAIGVPVLGMTLAAVVTADGYTQIRQAEAVQLVITGTNLESTTAVALGEIAATLVSATPTEVRTDIWIEHGTAPGPRTLTVSSLSESASLVDAIELTAFIVSTAGTDDGHGTYQSPLLLCSPGLRENAWAGDIILLSAGDHACSESIETGAALIAGEGVDTTFVTSTGGDFAFFLYGPATLRDMTITTEAPAVDVYGTGPFAFDHLRVNGWGIRILGGPPTVTITDVQVTGALPGVEINGAGWAMVNVANSQFSGQTTAIVKTADGQLTLTGSEIEACGTGVEIGRGYATLTGVTIDSCDLGLRVGVNPVYPFGQVGTVSVTDSVLVDNTTGAAMLDGLLRLTNTAIVDDETTPRACTKGVGLSNGRLTMQGGSITGQDQVGIEAYVGNSGTEWDYSMTITGALIEGGQRGVYGHGYPDCGGLTMHSSIVRDQSVAAVSWADNEDCPPNLTGNELSVISGFALEDLRNDPPPSSPILAGGTTLNGNTYTGTVTGPVSVAPDYRIVADGTIQF